MRQRQIHVVAAQHQVLAHGGARQRGQAATGCPGCPGFCRFYADQCQVSGTTAYIYYQHQTAVGKLLRQLIALQQQPVMKGCLRFFQQMHLLQTGQTGSLQRQCACALIE